MKRAGPRDDRDVLLGITELERDVGARERARDIEHQTGGKDELPWADDLRVQGQAEADLHVRREHLDRVIGGCELDP